MAYFLILLFSISIHMQTYAMGPKKTPSLTSVISNVQKKYDITTDFTAQFEQRYEQKIFKRQISSSGIVQFKKPGLMRWDYTNPNKKSFIIDGKALWVYDEAEKSAQVNRCFNETDLTASVAFLLGRGKIAKEFNATWFKGNFGAKEDYSLELNPKKKNAVFKKLLLIVDPITFRVKQSIVIDWQDNVNQFIFKEAKYNTQLGASLFQFKPPVSTHVVNIPGSCESKGDKN